MQSEVYLIFTYAFFSFLLALVLLFVSKFLSPTKLFEDKYSSYECGFEPFQSSQSQFDVRFYLVSILFIIFDLEIMFLFPWSMDIVDVGLGGFIAVLLFVVILTIGFLYEWAQGGLDWK